MGTAAKCPPDFRLEPHQSLPDSYEMSQVLLARARFDGTLQLLTAGWERVLGYRRGELDGRTLLQLMWANRRSTAAAVVTALLDTSAAHPLDVTLRCKDERNKYFRFHRRFDPHGESIFLVADELS